MPAAVILRPGSIYPVYVLEDFPQERIHEERKGNGYGAYLSEYQ